MKTPFIPLLLAVVGAGALLSIYACSQPNIPAPPSGIAAPTGARVPDFSVPGDPLTGSGNVARSVLTYQDLLTGSSTSPVDDSAFALPANAAMPGSVLEGRLELSGESSSGGFSEITDLYGASAGSDNPRKHLPEFSFEFVQNGSHLIPVIQELVYTGHPFWNTLIGPGRAWKENGDHGYSRAAFPFTLVERNANCTHNGVMTFLFKETSISQVRYQVTQETCAYFKFNMWGQLAGNYSPHTIINAAGVRTRYAAEVANRLPLKPISALADDYPGAGIKPAVFGSGITPADMTFYGVLFNGTNYVGGCATRFGVYAFCEDMRAPSYSTAKSAFASLALMRLGRKYGTDVYSMLIRDYVPETASSAGIWSNVTFENAIDMATGNYRQPGDESDESSASMDAFFLAETTIDKMTAALVFPHQASPGSFWNYHTSDTFILARAMNNYLQAQPGSSADIFNMLRSEVYDRIHLSAGVSTLRTGNSAAGVPLGGYGLFWTPDDIAKIAKLLNNDHGAVAGEQLLDGTMLADAMQKNPAERGLDTTGLETFKYQHAFWAKQITPAEFRQFKCSFWVPFMSGYGGITVAMLPNGVTYYYFSDNQEYNWYNAMLEANKLRPYCA